MKKVILAALFAGFVVGANAEDAASSGASAGAFIGVTAGGDIEESEAAYGGQVQIPLGKDFFVELSVVAMSDSYESSTVKLDSDLTSIGLSIGAKAVVGKNCGIYGLFGPNYNMEDSDVEYNQDVYPGFEANIDSDDEIGFHAAIGSTYNIRPNVQFFVEYRYTFLDIEGELDITSGDGRSAGDEIEGSFDFGVAKAGLNVIF